MENKQVTFKYGQKLHIAQLETKYIGFLYFLYLSISELTCEVK